VFGLVACSTAEPQTVIELDTMPTVTPRIVYVTPTREATPIATFALETQIATSVPDVPTGTPDFSAELAMCTSTLTNLYTEASENCLGEPSGFFCNGGLPPNATARGNVANVSSSMGLLGSLVPIDVVASVETSGLMTNNSGGLMWVRLPDPIDVNALLLGRMTLTDITASDVNLPDWQAISVVTDDTIPTSSCTVQPYSTFVVQGPWGNATNIAINGISVELRGSLAIQTHGLETVLIALEGESLLNIFGERRVLVAGQQLRVPYADRTFRQPSGAPDAVELLNYAYIEHLPIPLLDRPVLLPQPAVVEADGNVNLRSEPSIDSQRLAEIPPGIKMSIIAMNPERTWYHVRLPNGDIGWMRADLVTGDIGTIDLTYDVTPVPPDRFGDASNSAMVVAPTGANLRVDPDVQFEVIRVLPEGTQVEILARSPYSPFVKVDTGTEIGWLALITLETTTVVQFLPVDYVVRLPPGPTATPSFTFGGGHAYPDPRSGN